MPSHSAIPLQKHIASFSEKKNLHRMCSRTTKSVRHCTRFLRSTQDSLRIRTLDGESRMRQRNPCRGWHIDSTCSGYRYFHTGTKLQIAREPSASFAFHGLIFLL